MFCSTFDGNAFPWAAGFVDFTQVFICFFEHPLPRPPSVSCAVFDPKRLLLFAQNEPRSAPWSLRSGTLRLLPFWHVFCGPWAPFWTPGWPPSCPWNPCYFGPFFGLQNYACSGVAFCAFWILWGSQMRPKMIRNLQTSITIVGLRGLEKTQKEGRR